MEQYKTISFRITGASPLLMHNGQLADPLNPIARQMRKVTSKRAKTDADYEESARIEFLGSLYLANGEPCIPGEILEAAFVEAAKKTKKGNQAKAGLVSDGLFALEYDGPRKPDQLWKEERFRLVKGVKVQRVRIMRTRPVFREWAATVSFDYRPSMLNKSDVIDIVTRLGDEIGIGDWRPKFGRFSAEVVG